jgi:hypothetical protein
MARRITVFLRSLTQHWAGKLIAVIVSGYDGDGAAALCRIKEVGGITIAQKLDTAGQQNMPESAIQTGCLFSHLRTSLTKLHELRTRTLPKGITKTNNRNFNLDGEPQPIGATACRDSFANRPVSVKIIRALKSPCGRARVPGRFVRAAISPHGYDQLTERRFEIIPFWGFWFFCFTPCGASLAVSARRRRRGGSPGRWQTDPHQSLQAVSGPLGAPAVLEGNRRRISHFL